MSAPLLRDVPPDFADELRALLLEADRPDLAVEVQNLQVTSRHQCGHWFCQSFHTESVSQGPSGSGEDGTIPLSLEMGMVIVDIADGRITFVEVLDRPDVEEALQAAGFPGHQRPMRRRRRSKNHRKAAKVPGDDSPSFWSWRGEDKFGLPNWVPLMGLASSLGGLIVGFAGAFTDNKPLIWLCFGLFGLFGLTLLLIAWAHWRYYKTTGRWRFPRESR